MYILFITIISFIIVGLIYFKIKSRQHYFARPLMTKFEQKMYTQLKVAFPQYNILCQVAFSALITNSDYKIRNKFNRKVTDFVLINQQYEVIAIIELDDPSHLSKQAEDRFRDYMLIQAGYHVLRYTAIPSTKVLKQQINYLS